MRASQRQTHRVVWLILLPLLLALLVVAVARRETVHRAAGVPAQSLRGSEP